jgi:osmotically-inducible protein OsmY
LKPNTSPLPESTRRTALLLLGLAGTAALASACAPLIVGGAVVGTALVAADRRTTGAQVEDQAIELKGGARAREVSPAGNISVTSFNRQVLITGEVPNDVDRRAVEQQLRGIENVRSVTNELGVMGNSSATARTNDGLLSTRVKAALVDARDVQAHTIKVTAERGTIYLMGLVTEREATRAAEVARAVSGVQRVVRVFEVISEAELARIQPPAPR